MTRWYVTGYVMLGDCENPPPRLDLSTIFLKPASAWDWADHRQECSDPHARWGVYSLRPVGRVTVREQGGQE